MTQHFINGRYVAGRTGETMAVLAPATGEEFTRIACGNAQDIDDAVKAAQAAYEGAWGKLTAAERGRLISKLALKVQDHFEELAKIEAQDTGKPMAQARADIEATARYFEFYGGAADKVHGHIIPFLNGYSVNVVHEPYGVTGHILPWNYPAQMIGRSLTASLAMGNAVVLKPAEDACQSALRLAELASEVGFPDGAINIVTGRGHEAGEALCRNPGVGFISFTGSPQVGQIIQKACADNFITCTLELGGKSPQIIFDDADFDAAIPTVCKAIVQNTGQTCSAGSRVLVQKNVYDDFIGAVAKEFTKLRAGTPEMDLDCGPVINAKQRARVQSFIDQAREQGIPVLAEGAIAQGVPNGGFYVTPTLFGQVPRGNRLEQEEVFGPVLAAFSFEDEEDAVRLANSTDYGLVAGVWTGNGGRQQRVAKRVRAGQVFINGYGAGGGIELPFGGTGKSGHGREKGFMALEEFAVTKTIVHKHG
ncbi:MULTISPECIES: aldehyde dehydrogenase family protein [unclassified Bosea (in: a-proteobacteria)]|jgi:aldehyde dehydrogenase (NAD+)|uniref:aldehyde dehydrogenase family protein n=1 Tax=Bosea sp. (in: a-proteobacteria) TaxID=1871050 RepID=UPI00086CC39C|nr:aldehyde dehydrogenase family protein [Bosea sp. (in: a-proteobacteria)]MBN9470549.1 aldehyde dehydrogenase family protein [Bosea sp. (in: a-proteobacteria)]ODT49745.1 MAG: aldehyde dehydrogenase [Methylobacterium sp. SCN 67-24]